MPGNSPKEPLVMFEGKPIQMNRLFATVNEHQKRTSVPRLHIQLENLCMGLGYSVEGGVCHGYAMKWLEEALLGEEDLFDNTIERMSAAYIGLIKRIKKLKAQGVNDPEAEELYDFLTSMAVYQNPSLSGIAAEPAIDQYDLEVSSLMGGSRKIRNVGGMSRIYTMPFILDAKETKAYFDDLQQVLDQLADNKYPCIGMGISSYDHSIALTYHPDKGWKFKNVEAPSTKQFAVACTQQLIDEMFQAFSAGTDYPYLAFNLSIIITGDQSESLKDNDLFKDLKQKYVLTRELAQREEKVGLLHLAVMTNNWDVFDTLTKSDVNLDKQDPDGLTAAMLAAQNVSLLMIKQLHELGANFNLTDAMGANIAMIATINGYASVLAELAQLGVDLNQPISEKGSTLAHLAAQEGQHTIVPVLVANKVSLNPNLENVPNPAVLATMKGHTLFLQELAKHGVDLRQLASDNGETLAYLAAQTGQASMLPLLQMLGVDLNQAIANGTTPAFIAAQNGHVHVIDELGRLGADLNKPRLDGFNPVCAAAYSGHAMVIMTLKKYGADVDKPTRDGKTAVFLATAHGNKGAIKALKKSGAQMNLPYISSKTQLLDMVSGQESRYSKMKEFIHGCKRNGAKSTAISLTPLDLARILDNVEMVRLLDEQTDKNQADKKYKGTHFKSSSRGSKKELDLEKGPEEELEDSSDGARCTIS